MFSAYLPVFLMLGVAALVAWLEQLIAESTGKQGKAVIPVDGETLAAPELYGDDRLFVYLRLESAPDADNDVAQDDSGTPAADRSDAMSRKAVNDSVAWIRSLADLRGRNADWAESAVREAVSITSEEALELGVIDLIANDIDDLLQKVDGRVVETGDTQVTLQTLGLRIERVTPDWRVELLSVITSPTIAYLLLLIGIYGLVLEGYNPGTLVPGVVGAISLLLALYALQMLPVNYAGLALIILGVVLMIAEVMVPSFGALGIDKGTGGQHLERLFARDVAGQRDHRRGTEQPDVDPVDAKARVVGGDGHVAGGDQLAARGGGNPVGLRDDRLRHALDRLHQGAAARKQIGEIGCSCIFRLSSSLHFLKVMTRAERLACP